MSSCTVTLVDPRGINGELGGRGEGVARKIYVQHLSGRISPEFNQDVVFMQ